MAELANILVVSDLHFGEELLPGAGAERRRAVELASAAFREFLAHHAARRRDGRPWRLVINGDLFDFMSVMVPVGDPEAPPAPAGAPPPTADERLGGLPRGARTGPLRMRRICEAHRPLLVALGRFAAAGHCVDIVVGNHDIELLAPEVVAELVRHLRDALGAGGAAALPGARDAVLARIRVVPWFVYVPGVAWIEHGHVYDEGCSFERTLAPMDPEGGNLLFNVDYAAVRYLGMAVPEIDPHGIEAWGFWGYLRYAIGQGARSAGRIWLGYARFVLALLRARGLHRSPASRERRRRAHAARLAEVARDAGLPLPTVQAIDRLARAPVTGSLRRVGRLLMLDRLGILAGLVATLALALALLPLGWALAACTVAIAGAAGVARWLGDHLVTSQLPMRAVPERLRAQVDAPVVVLGHTHDPRWQPLRDGGLYVNTGTWLPATRPGLRRSFTFVQIQPRAGAPPDTDLRQWREGATHAFDPGASLGAGVHTLTGLRAARDSGVRGGGASGRGRSAGRGPE